MALRGAIQARGKAMNTIRNGIVGAICFVLLAAPNGGKKVCQLHERKR
jgi:hypothetical protein